jgi:molybdenum-dependent DNA-binding transcriptional regulator ModE
VSILLMSEKELRRKTMFEEIKAKRMTLKEGARRLGLSYRHIRRSFRRFAKEGDAGLVHRSRGRPSNRSKPAAFRAKVLARYKARYRGFGATLAAEKLAKEGLHVDHETLRRWLLAAALLERRRKCSNHRERRERKLHFGEMVQMDGSIHPWFGKERESACKMGMIDDATNERLALMDTGETTKLAMRSLWEWIERYGIPQSLYTDKKSVFVTDREPTLEEQLAGEVPKTAFGKACAKLDIEIITAHSPQAKGRVERSHGVFQDRFVKELQLRGITTITSANKVLLNGFTDDLNAKFALEPASDIDFHRPVPKGLNLADVFCFEEHRTVQNDWTIRFQNRHYQIEKGNRRLPKPKDKVLVRVRLDKTMQLLYRGKPLKFRALCTRELRKRLVAEPRPQPPKTPKETSPSRPRSKTPWRQGCTLMFADTKKGK